MLRFREPTGLAELSGIARALRWQPRHRIIARTSSEPPKTVLESQRHRYKTPAALLGRQEFVGANVCSRLSTFELAIGDSVPWAPPALTELSVPPGALRSCQGTRCCDFRSRRDRNWKRAPGIASPNAVARVNLYVLWVGCQLSLLGGRRPIATQRCDRRRATIDSCASRQVLNPKAP